MGEVGRPNPRRLTGSCSKFTDLSRAGKSGDEIVAKPIFTPRADS